LNIIFIIKNIILTSIIPITIYTIFSYCNILENSYRIKTNLKYSFKDK